MKLELASPLRSWNACCPDVLGSVVVAVVGPVPVVDVVVGPVPVVDVVVVVVVVVVVRPAVVVVVGTAVVVVVEVVAGALVVVVVVVGGAVVTVVDVLVVGAPVVELVVDVVVVVGPVPVVLVVVVGAAVVEVEVVVVLEVVLVVEVVGVVVVVVVVVDDSSALIARLSISGWSTPDGAKLRRTKAWLLLAAARETVKSESTAVTFSVPAEVKASPSLENSTPTEEVPLVVRAPRLSDQLVPVCPAPLRSASNTTLAAAGASIASDSVETWPSELSTLKASKSRSAGASRFEASEPPTAALGTNSSVPLPAETAVEPNWPSANMVPKAADSKPAPKVGSRSE